MDTIISLATPPMKSAIAMIRLSGDDVLSIITPLFKNVSKLKHRAATYGDLLDINGDIIDEVIVIYYKGPNSYTGEDMIELTCHGSMIIVNRIISSFIARGARLAERGEYTSRAFYHNKMDLVQAESVASLIDAKTEEQQKLSLFALKGKASKSLDPLKKMFADLLSNIEVNIDYPEYNDIEEVNIERVILLTEKALNEVDILLKKAKKANEFIKGINVALVGRPNVGKSSLLNALLGERKAIVTDIPGTTRDIVEGELNLEGMLFHFYDTAGIRSSHDIIEEEGIKKAKEMIDKADLVLYIKDVSNDDDKEEELVNIFKNKEYIKVYNKIDLVSKNIDGVKISAVNNDIKELLDELKSRFYLDTTLEPSLCSSREIGYLEKIKEDVLKAKEEVNYLPIDLIEVYLKDAYDAIKMILGEIPTPDLQEEVFSRFCVGK